MINDRENFLVDKENQYKREKFQRMANTRVNAVLNGIDKVCILSNPRQFVYTEEEVRQIVDVLSSKVAYLKRRFEGKEERTFCNNFSLKEEEGGSHA